MPNNILDAIGNTPLLELTKVVPPGSARVLAKQEGANPTGSMKDRMALAMVAGAEADGRLQPGGVVIEFTGGSTGTSLAMVCAAKGYQLLIVTSNVASPGKRDHMRALGAQLKMVSNPSPRMTREIYQEMVDTTQRLIVETGAVWMDQFHNLHQVDGYESLGREIWEQSEGQVDAFVHVVGTGGSLGGTATTLRGYQPGLHVVAVEPAESPVLSGGQPGSHRIEGVGIGQIPPLWQGGLANEIEQVSTADAEAMARRLAREEGVFVGTSSGANVVAALRLAARLGAGKTVVTLLPDDGWKYLSTDLFQAA